MIKIIIVLAVLVLSASAALAQAQRRPALTGNPIEDIKAATQPAPSLGGTMENKVFAALADPFLKLAAFIGVGLDNAVSLSTVIPTLQDTNGQACWVAMQDFSAVIKAHPVPLTLHVAADLEALRLLTMTANKLCANPACTIVFSDLANTAQTASPIPLPIPSLSQLCSKIGQLAPMMPVSALGVTLPAAPTK